MVERVRLHPWIIVFFIIHLIVNRMGKKSIDNHGLCTLLSFEIKQSLLCVWCAFRWSGIEIPIPNHPNNRNHPIRTSVQILLSSSRNIVTVITDSNPLRKCFFLAAFYFLWICNTKPLANSFREGGVNYRDKENKTSYYRREVVKIWLSLFTSCKCRK